MYVSQLLQCLLLHAGKAWDAQGWGGPSQNVSMNLCSAWRVFLPADLKSLSNFCFLPKWEARVSPASCQTPSASFPGSYLIWSTAPEHSLAVLSLTLLSDWVSFLARLWGCWVTWGKSFLLGETRVVFTTALEYTERWAVKYVEIIGYVIWTSISGWGNKTDWGGQGACGWMRITVRRAQS